MAYNSAGKNDGAGNDREIFERKAATDVLKYFKETNVARPLITNDSIESGKSKAFPIVGQVSADKSRTEETVSELGANSPKATERVIAIENLVTAHSWITDLDDAMVNYNAKSAHIESIGRALAKQVDEDIILKVIEAGKIDDATAAGTAGLKAFTEDRYTQKQTQTIVDSSGVATGQEVYKIMAAAMTEFRDKDAVGDPVYLLRPQHYFALLNNPSQCGLTWVNDPYAMSGKVPMVLGSKVMYSPHFPAFDSDAEATNTIGVLFSKECAGILELLSVSIKADYIPLRLSHLMVGKLAVGYGILAHQSAIAMELTNAEAA